MDSLEPVGYAVGHTLYSPQHLGKWCLLPSDISFALKYIYIVPLARDKCPGPPCLAETPKLSHTSPSSSPDVLFYALRWGSERIQRGAERGSLGKLYQWHTRVQL